MGPVDKYQVSVNVLFILVINAFIFVVFHMCHMCPFYLMVGLLLFPFHYYLHIMRFLTTKIHESVDQFHRICANK